ncbi:Na(+)-translocating NADH-quinone reductase subunit A [bacterium]|nr:Na(+)-translocating NADH-quinone reductase subunit A [bacterium]MBU1063784.1 Na(+)-translocating NADH-quinone reductase subunit A [bacterium]MBU1633456.1 Na(+)-translocating NADH-quinone reductase subunit A [bacterium]MBU1874493.1 Na(+)-translocating NADH-quinone reductase subunit A [bacterium]
MIKLKKGLNLPINGEPEQAVYDTNPVKKVALVGPDYTGMKPDLAVSVGDTVKLGQLLFSDKKTPAIRYTSPGPGKVIEINRGEKRVFLSMVIELQGNEELTFHFYNADQINTLDRNNITSQLLESGLWTALRNRPFETVADPDTVPHSIFITAMDTNPLAPDVEKIVRLKSNEFIAGMKIVAKLTDGKLFLCKSKNSDIPTCHLENLKVEEFDGPHPSGNVGTHIHFLDPVSRTKTVWHLMAQDVIAIGHLFLNGRILTERIISFAGPSVKQPRLLKTRLGASITDLSKNELKDGNQRVISGSVLHGFRANDALAYLGRYHQQVTVIPEGGVRKLFGWLSPGFNIYSVKNIVVSKLFPHKKFDFNTNLHGGIRSIVPIGSYEKVMPLDILPTFLLRALAVDDIDEAEKLGCLELAEEDLALCTYVCPSKIEHGENLRRVLTLIEKEG